ncbi:MAG TPA: cytochrome c1 [Steroidobacteraceae bacterium]|nr:cytochrome c1 [Steroidobacteraceae bacterium]HRX88721.1 cytochrome c1 [Steroidobacteraceae bacterium]
MRTKIVLLAAAIAATHGLVASAATGIPGDWQHWSAEVEINNLASRQRGARNFMSYCSGCHSIKYLRYSRLAKDLDIAPEQLQKFLLPPDAKSSDYMTTSMLASDGAAWFGTAPPDLSLITRSKGADYVYRFLKTFYLDPGKPSGVNNLALEGTAMPHVLSSLQGLQSAVFRNEEIAGEGGEPVTVKTWEKFQLDVPGTLSAAEYDQFVGDLINFLQYAGEPAQVDRQKLGVWVVLFLLVFTLLAYLLKREYWRDVR